MPRIIGWMAAVAAVLGVALWLAWQRTQPPPLTPGAPQPETAPPAAQPEPAIRHPVPPLAEPKPLPPLDGSDTELRDALSALGAEPTWLERAVFEHFVRRVVATVDSLTTARIPQRLLPVKPPAGKFMVATDAEGIRMRPENSQRYAPYIRALQAIDVRKAAALYVQYYPLFQQAYEELGYPKGYFNDRLIEVIDHLLATPEVREPVGLVQPKVMYQFADPELEARSAGQKLLMRIGNANAAVVKEKLRALRAELTASPPAPPG